MKDRIRQYLEKHHLSPTKLATLAGIKPWSLVRFLKDEKAGITYRTYEKLSVYMMQNP